MAEMTESHEYLVPGVLLGLHRHKVGQYGSLERVTVLSSVILLVVIALAMPWGDGGQMASRLTYRSGLSLPNSVGRPPSRRHPFNVPIGYVGKVTIVCDGADLFSPPERLPEFGIGCPAPGVFEFPHQVDDAPAPLSTDSDFGLPEPPPLWRFAEHRLPARVVDQSISSVQPPHAVLASPVWPARVWLVDDTAVVEGLLTFHAHGLLSFDLVSENPPGLGFGAAVRNAVDQSTCFPSVDESGRRITVSCRYRCLFVPGGQSSVSVGASVTATIRKD